MTFKLALFFRAPDPSGSFLEGWQLLLFWLSFYSFFFLLYYLPIEMTRCVNGLLRRPGCCVRPGIRKTFGFRWKHQRDAAPRASEKKKNTHIVRQYRTHNWLGWSAVQTWGKAFVYLLTQREKDPLQRNTMTQMAAACEAVPRFSWNRCPRGSESHRFPAISRRVCRRLDLSPRMQIQKSGRMWMLKKPSAISPSQSMSKRPKTNT